MRFAIKLSIIYFAEEFTYSDNNRRIINQVQLPVVTLTLDLALMPTQQVSNHSVNFMLNKCLQIIQKNIRNHFSFDF